MKLRSIAVKVFLRRSIAIKILKKLKYKEYLFSVISDTTIEFIFVILKFKKVAAK